MNYLRGAEDYMKNVALLIIDMQNDFVQPEFLSCVSGAKATIPAIVQVLEWFRENEFPVFHIVREHREDGSDVELFRYDKFVKGEKYAVSGTYGCEIVSELVPNKGEYRIVKKRFSGFMNTELNLILRRKDIDTVIITGTQYPNCIRATAYDAVALDYHVTVLTEATSAANEQIAKSNIIDMKNIGINCIESKDLISK